MKKAIIIITAALLLIGCSSNSCSSTEQEGSTKQAGVYFVAKIIYTEASYNAKINGVDLKCDVEAGQVFHHEYSMRDVDIDDDAVQAWYEDCKAQHE